MPERTSPTSPRASGEPDAARAGASEEEVVDAEKIEEPETTGTVFLTLLLLMMIFGFWVMMYVILVDQ